MIADSDPGGKINADSSGSGSKALVFLKIKNLGIFPSKFFVLFFYQVSGKTDDIKEFVSDVMTHGADLKFLTISGQKFVQLSKVSFSFLNNNKLFDKLAFCGERPFQRYKIELFLWFCQFSEFS